jgi:hypothetical protein
MHNTNHSNMCEPCETQNNINVPIQFIEALTCSICQEVATLPVHGTCCDKAKALQPGCLSCVRKWYQQDRHPSKRVTSINSFNGCGCKINPNNRTRTYEHSVQLDMVRNLIGPSVCFHESCSASFGTCEELRRHLQGRARPSDKHPNCPEAITKCQHCSFFGKRRVVEGEHYETNHKKLHCPVCDKYVSKDFFKFHYNQHVKEVRAERENIKNIEASIMLRKEEVKNKNDLLRKLHDTFEQEDACDSATHAATHAASHATAHATAHAAALAAAHTGVPRAWAVEMGMHTETTNIHNVHAIYHGMGRPMHDSSSEDD